MDYKSIARSLRQLNTEPNATNVSMIDADGAAVDRVASAAIDDSSLVAPWFVPGSTPEVSKKGIHRNLEMYGKTGEFLVEPVSRSQFILTVKMESGAASTFSIDCRTNGALQGFSVRGAEKTFAKLSSLVKYYSTHGDTALPVKLVIPDSLHSAASPAVSMAAEYAISPQKATVGPRRLMQNSDRRGGNAHQKEVGQLASRIRDERAAHQREITGVMLKMDLQGTQFQERIGVLELQLQNQAITATTQLEAVAQRHGHEKASLEAETDARLSLFERRLGELDVAHQRALEDLREEHRMAMVVAADTYTETIKKERYERELTATKKDDGEMEKEVAATSAIAELRGMVDGLEGQLAQKANEITEALEQQLQQAKRFEEDTVTLFDDNKRYQKQIEDVKVQLLAQRRRAEMVSQERQDLVLKLARFESAGMTGGEAFDGFGDAGNAGTDPMEDPALMWDRAVMAPIEDGSRLKSAEAQVELLRLQEATIHEHIQIELDAFVN